MGTCKGSVGVRGPANSTHAIPVAVFCVGAVLRLVSLNADPYCPHWRGYLTDEGRWVDQARNLVLFSSLSENHLSQLHVAMAPGFQLASAVSFGVFGVDYWSARLYSAVCGTGLDTVPLPGDAAPEQLAAIILDVSAMALTLRKPLSCRLFPVPGKTAGERTEYDSPYLVNGSVLPLRGRVDARLFERFAP